MGKPNYRVVVTFDPQRMVFLARAPELEHLTGEGATRKDAMHKLEEEIDAQLANVLSQGGVPPKAVDEVDHSGEVNAKISKSLHRDLAFLARTEGVELDQIVSELLTQALTMRNQGRRGLRGAPQQMQSDDIGNRHEPARHSNADGNRADGNRRHFGGGRNAAMMDGAYFIEYVRGLEQGGQGQRAYGGGHSNHGGGQHHHNNNGGGGNNRRRRGGRGGGQGQGNHQGHNAQGHHGQNGQGHNGQNGQGHHGQARPQQPRPAQPAPSDSQE